LANDKGKAVIGADLVIYGDVRNAVDVEVLGSVIGGVDSDRVTIHPTGRVAGALNAGHADVDGHLEGRIRVRQLINIREGGVVRGDVRYGQLALAPGGDLAANVRNMPPHLDGDFEMTVRRGRATMVTPADLSATDAEDGASQLTYHVSNVQHGFLALSAAPRTAVESFSQADIAAGRVSFVHDGGDDATAGFDVFVTDSQGATSGAPRRVTVAVIAAA
jgi:cytoskeletal protein CcmA (bactofilin family)